MMLVAYFSASGRTARLAQTIAQAAQADLYEIRPAQPYTSADLNWHDAHSRSSVEMKDPACRPAIAGDLPDLSRYDTIFVGFPIWWYQAPRIVETFVASCGFSGKTVIPFATSGGSGHGPYSGDFAKGLPGHGQLAARQASGQRRKPGRCSGMAE